MKPNGIIEEFPRLRCRSYRFEPGNSTRYDVVMTRFRANPGTTMVAIVLTNHNKGGAVPSDCNDVGYLAEKLDINLGDAIALLPLVRYFVEQ